MKNSTGYPKVFNTAPEAVMLDELISDSFHEKFWKNKGHFRDLTHLRCLSPVKVNFSFTMLGKTILLVWLVVLVLIHKTFENYGFSWMFVEWIKKTWNEKFRN